MKMGLDMYLYLEKEDYNCSLDNDYEGYPRKLRDFEDEILKRNFGSINTRTQYQIGYWRKDNAIHQWFVDNCANGIDNCRDMYVSVEAAEELLSIVAKIKADHSLAKELLPTQEGFFFGTTDYDEWYFNALDYTERILREAINFVKENDDYSIIYSASW